MKRFLLVFLVIFSFISNADGQQNDQWYDVSGFAPSVKQCMICPTQNRLYICVYTETRFFNFWIEEPERSALLVMVENNDDFEMRRALFDKCIIEYLNNLPANTTIKELTQKGKISQNQTTRIEQQSGQPLLNEEYADCQNDQKYRNSNENKENYGQQSSKTQTQPSKNDSQEQEGNSMTEFLFSSIFIFLFLFWIVKKLFKGLFSTQKKSNTDKLYEDGAWFHDHQ